MNMQLTKSQIGLDGVPAAETVLSHVDGERGELIIAGERVGDLARRAAPQPCGDALKTRFACEVADALARDDQFAALAINMAQHGLGSRNAVQTNLALGEMHIHDRISYSPGGGPVGKVGGLDRLINLDYINQYEKIRRAVPFCPGSVG